MASRIGLYGGSFDPIHNGHLIIARAIAERLELQRLMFLPSAQPPHKRGELLAEPNHRAEMVKLAISDEPVFEFSDYDLTRVGPSYTIDTVEHFLRQFGPAAELYWIVGADSLAELTSWHRAGELIEACRIATAARAGWDRSAWEPLRAKLNEDQVAKLRGGFLETPVIDISSTEVRERVCSGRSIRFLVPDRTLDYIERYGLYRGPSADENG